MKMMTTSKTAKTKKLSPTKEIILPALEVKETDTKKTTSKSKVSKVAQRKSKKTIDTKASVLKEAKSKKGQPKKYDEPTKHVSFSLPVSDIENLKIISALKGMNQTQCILSFIRSEVEKHKQKIKAYKKLMLFSDET